ncbi:MAG: hypothetical protein NC453_28020, partial [Muribaculum sp.]|nr:hypothetical protein [Muribaculum sp.]
MKRYRILLLLLLTLLTKGFLYAQSFLEQYQDFKKEAESKYTSFREDCNKEYAQFLLTAWDWYEGKAPLPLPKDDNPIPPRPYEGRDNDTPIVIKPIDVNPIEETPQPKPIEPIKEQSVPNEKYFSFDFYGNKCRVRMPDFANLKIADCLPQSISNGWKQLCSPDLNNAIRDCLEARIRYNLCDWAYLEFLDRLVNEYCSNRNGATLLMAFLYCQSGYQMRLAVDGNNLVMLYGSKHQIYDKGYFSVDGLNFYPYGNPSNSISICNAAFEG